MGISQIELQNILSTTKEATQLTIETTQVIYLVVSSTTFSTNTAEFHFTYLLPFKNMPV